MELLGMKMSEEGSVEVGVELVGEGVGGKEGGVVEEGLLELEV